MDIPYLVKGGAPQPASTLAPLILRCPGKAGASKDEAPRQNHA